MNKQTQAIHNIHEADELAQRDSFLISLHPLSKLLVTIVYIMTVMSFHKYDWNGLMTMSLYLIIIMITGELSLLGALRRLKIVLMAVFFLGIANPFFDREIAYSIGAYQIRFGMISMLTLFFKAAFAVFASYILIKTTSIEDICYALQKLHVPSILITEIMLIHRYLIMMLRETQRMFQAYQLRAPGQKGIHYSAWGSFVGQLLLRSMDRAQRIHDGMLLRGFQGTFYPNIRTYRVGFSILYAALWCIAIITLRLVPLFTIIGRIVIH